jgi:hypothetical protein
MLSIFGFLSGAVSFALKVWGWFNTRSEQKAGADAQSARDNITAIQTETRIADAEANAPKSDDEVDQRLKDHSL